MRETVEDNPVAGAFPEAVGQTRPAGPSRNKLRIAAGRRDRTADQNVRNGGRGQEGAVGVPEEVGFEVQKAQFRIIRQPTRCRDIRHLRRLNRISYNFGLALRILQ